MRAFHPVILILLNTWYLVIDARLPYIKSSGYYSPFPPKENRVIYEFSPLVEPVAETESKSRVSRDLAWREFDAFLNGAEEPSCADLRRMWILARKLQDEAVESNEIPRDMQLHHPFKGREPAAAGTYSTKVDNSIPRGRTAGAEKQPMSQSNKGIYLFSTKLANIHNTQCGKLASGL